jgi:hypothetical protein
LKIGNIIRFKATGEIFFIDSVQQSYSISEGSLDRTTTINVSRGMIEQLIYGFEYQNASGVNKSVGYFNIINTTLNYKEKKTTTQKAVPRNPPPTNITPQSTFVVTAVAQPTLVTGIQFLEKYNNYPANKDLFIRFINGITSSGYSVTLLPLSTNRSYIQQAALKAANPLNASPGSSQHEVGKAIDISVKNSQSGKYYSKNTSQADWISTGVPGIASSLGLQWGGPTNDGTFGSYVDRVHFQLTTSSPGNNVNNIPVEYDYVNVTTSGLDRDAIFSNFKVDPFVFNFFLKGLQNDPSYRNVISRQISQNGAQVLPTATVTAKKKVK